MSFLSTLKKYHIPFASGYSSDIYMRYGKVIKVLEDGCYEDTLKEVALQQTAADAGLAPQIYSVFEVPGAVVIIMEAIDTDKFKQVVENTPIGYEPIRLGGLDNDAMMLGSMLYANLIKAGIIHADFHVQNWLRCDDEAIALDFGVADYIQDASYRHLTVAVTTLTPALMALKEFELLYEMSECSSSCELRGMLKSAANLITDH